MNFVLLVFLSSVSVVDAPESQVIGSHEPVKATVGDDVILPCHLEPPFDVNALTVQWTCNKTFVHVFRNRKDSPGLQSENFRGRTSLFHNELIRGNISLKLTNVTERDEGNYTCFVPKLDSQVRRGNVTLIVEPAEGRKDNNQTNNTSHDIIPPTVSTRAVIIITAAYIIAGIVICLLLRRCFRRGPAEPQEGYELTPKADKTQPDSHARQRRVRTPPPS